MQRQRAALQLLSIPSEAIVHKTDGALDVIAQDETQDAEEEVASHTKTLVVSPQQDQPAAHEGEVTLRVKIKLELGKGAVTRYAENTETISSCSESFASTPKSDNSVEGETSEARIISKDDEHVEWLKFKRGQETIK